MGSFWANRRAFSRPPAAAVLIVVFLVMAAFPTSAHATTARTAEPPPPEPKAFVLVDADTGAVLAEQNDHSSLPPASTIKLLTALIAAQRLTADDEIPISPLAEGMPARKINVKAGQTWRYVDLLHSMLLVSANDAAVAIAEKIGGGSLDGYVPIAAATAARLGLDDNPVLYDPAGLDDQFSNKGGDDISPRDLAIVARAVLATPAIMQVIATKDYKFTGGDGLGHTLTNHDLFLDLYPGATGLKTGTTDLAGHTFVGTATRDGRTMLAVVLDAPDSYGSAERLLDQGFATPVGAESAVDHLPAVVENASFPPPPPPPQPHVVAATVPVHHHTSWIDSPAVALAFLIVGSVPLVLLRRRVARGGSAGRVPDEPFGLAAEE